MSSSISRHLPLLNIPRFSSPEKSSNSPNRNKNNRVQAAATQRIKSPQTSNSTTRMFVFKSGEEETIYLRCLNARRADEAVFHLEKWEERYPNAELEKKAKIYTHVIDKLWKSTIKTDHASAVELFDEMKRKGIEPNEITYTAMIHGYYKNQKMDEGYHFINKEKVFFVYTIEFTNSIVSAYCSKINTLTNQATIRKKYVDQFLSLGIDPAKIESENVRKQSDISYIKERCKNIIESVITIYEREDPARAQEIRTMYLINPFLPKQITDAAVEIPQTVLSSNEEELDTFEDEFLKEILAYLVKNNSLIEDHTEDSTESFTPTNELEKNDCDVNALYNNYYDHYQSQSNVETILSTTNDPLFNFGVFSPKVVELFKAIMG